MLLFFLIITLKAFSSVAIHPHFLFVHKFHLMDVL